MSADKTDPKPIDWDRDDPWDIMNRKDVKLWEWVIAWDRAIGMPGKTTSRGSHDK